MKPVLYNVYRLHSRVQTKETLIYVYRAECTFINNKVWCAVGWSEIALFAIFENEPSAADQV